MVHDAYYSRLYLSKIGNEEEVISFDLKPWDAINIAFRCKVCIMHLSRDLSCSTSLSSWN